MLELTEKERKTLLEIINSVNVPGKMIEEVYEIKKKIREYEQVKAS